MKPTIMNSGHNRHLKTKDKDFMTSATIPSDFDTNRFFNSFIAVARAILLTPKAFFQKMTRTGGFKSPVIFMVVCVVIHTLIAGPLRRMQGLMLQNLFMGIIIPFLTAGVFFLILTRLYKSPGTYEATFRMNAYASAVGLVTWIPILGILFEFYRLYILVVGLRAVYAIKTSWAVLTIFLTLIVYTVLFKAVLTLTGGQFIGL